MNSDEYIQLLQNCFSLAKKGEIPDEALPYINQVRLLHGKFQKELEYFLVDPISCEKQEERDKVNAIAREIREVCISSVDLKYQFFKIPQDSSEFRQQFKGHKNFARYYYKDTDITELIVFKKSDKKYKYIKDDLQIDIVDDKDIKLNELQFTDEPPAGGKKEGMIYGHDESDINKIHGVDL